MQPGGVSRTVPVEYSALGRGREVGTVEVGTVEVGTVEAGTVEAGTRDHTLGLATTTPTEVLPSLPRYTPPYRAITP